MLILKRLVVWLVERTVEAILLAEIFLYAAVLGSGGWSSVFGHFKLSDLADVLQVRLMVIGIMVAVLFRYGYYFTQAIVGVAWRAKRWWLYPSISAGIFVICAHIAFVRFSPDSTPQFKAFQMPFLALGACVVFSSCFAGSLVLRRWGDEAVILAPYATSPYLAALGMTLLVFLLANIANYLRPAGYNSNFRPYGLPFTFYREGAVTEGWVRHPARVIWSGVIADAAVFAAAVTVLGNLWQRTQTVRQKAILSDGGSPAQS